MLLLETLVKHEETSKALERYVHYKVGSLVRNRETKHPAIRRGVMLAMTNNKYDEQVCKRGQTFAVVIVS